MKDIKAFVFDLDGTIINTLTDIALTVNLCLRNQSLPEHTEEEYLNYIGPGVDFMLRSAMPERLQGDDKLLSAILEDYKAAYARDCLNNPTPYEGIEEVFRALKAKGIKICVLSNKTDKFTGLMVEKVFPNIEFDAVMGGREDIPLKPEPDGFYYVCRKVGVDPAQAVMVGDAETDIGTAKNAGAKMMVATWGFRTREHLLAHGGENLIDKPSDILKFLE